MDTEYLKSTVGSALVRGCAATIAASPVDPIEYLSLWLLKHVENSKISEKLYEEKQREIIEEMKRKEEKLRLNAIRNEQKRKENEMLEHLSSIKNDPYLLWDTCFSAISTFTGFSSIYTALVLDKLWEDPIEKKMRESGEEGDGNEEEQNNEEENGEEEEEEAVEEEEVEKTNNDTEAEGNQQSENTESGDPSQQVTTKKKEKRPKPPNYKKKILLYVAATHINRFLINKQVDKKQVPVTYKLLLEGRDQIHIENVLYEEGIHFFRGMPRFGAYFAVPVVLNTIPIQVTAILCVDTLKQEQFGSGNPFNEEQRDFILSVAKIAGDALTKCQKEACENYNTISIKKVLQERIQLIRDSHKGKNVSVSKNDREEAEKGEQKEDPDENVNIEDDGGDQEKEEEEEEEEEEEVEKEEEEEEDEEAVENAEGEGEEGEEGDHGDNDNAKMKQKVQKKLKKQRKSIQKMEAKLKKLESMLAKQGDKAAMLGKKLGKLTSNFQCCREVLSAVTASITEVEIQEFSRIKKWMFPPMVIFRILKGVLHILGYSRSSIDDWTQARQAFGDNFCTVLKSYDPARNIDKNVWEKCDVFIGGITEENLSVEAPIGYLGHSWVLAAKDAGLASVKLNKCQAYYEKTVKVFMDVEVEKMVMEIDMRVSMDEEKQLTVELDSLEGKTITSNPTLTTPEDQAEEEEED